MKWPEGTRESQKRHALNHAMSADYLIDLCEHRRTAIQAGGNVGLWPKRMAAKFQKVITFEPEPVSFSVLCNNLRGYSNVEIRPEALGDKEGFCGIERLSLGSHKVIPGESVKVIAIDSLGLQDLDLLQLDIEGYELKALRGAARTIRRCRPVIQIEMRDFTANYGDSDIALEETLGCFGYVRLCERPGNDVIFVRRDNVLASTA